MKKTLLSFCALFLMYSFSLVSAQRSSVGVHATTTEYIADLSNDNYLLFKFNPVKVGGALSLQQRLNASFNLVEWAGYNKIQYLRKLSDVVPGQINGVDADDYVINLMSQMRLKKPTPE